MHGFTLISASPAAVTLTPCCISFFWHDQFDTASTTFDYLCLYIFQQDFKYVILWVEELDLAWAPFSSPRSGRSTLIVWCSHSLFSHLPRYLTLLWSHTMPPFLSINLLRMQMNAWFLTTRPSMTSASAHWSSPPPPVSETLYIVNLVLVLELSLHDTF